MKRKKIRIIHYGLGPIGMETARLAQTKSNLKTVGAVDISPDLVGKDLGTILGLGRRLGVVVTDNPQRLFGEVEADVVLHTAGSRIQKIFDQLVEIIEAGINIISSSEELLFPLKENARLAARLHNLAVENKVTVLGTGVNPGFVMDALPVFLTAVCQDVRTVTVRRVVDATTRRYPLQKKIGAGMDPRDFHEQIARHELGHVGLRESLYLVAGRLGMELDDVMETIEPVLADKPVKSSYFSLTPGEVAGIKHIVKGNRQGERVITLELYMYLGAEDPHDAVCICGTPNINLRIEGGVAGDQATAAVLVNSIAAVMAAPPGLTTVTEITPPHYFR
ncbi:MAG TPA: hypothetical protein PK836_04695 [Syntrophales bacterium]|nr:hypothetical protein [Syntrophales bacterium]HOM06913.1 hypothetical protein [Syntrophales bacterium]HON98775.1 hypothetical protein [Syntrophales bacterium]HPC00965.1 hypothetical protein [Syntrophales bacterium]HPQ06454.1 hypothetical protein [Syntrophales bacterium]